MNDNSESLFNDTFFNFLLGFVIILSIGMGVIFAVNYYDLTYNDVKQTAAALLFGE